MEMPVLTNLMFSPSCCSAGEAEHAAIGHNAALNFVPQQHMAIMRQAMADHDRDFAAFYNHAADMMEC